MKKLFVAVFLALCVDFALANSAENLSQNSALNFSKNSNLNTQNSSFHFVNLSQIQQIITKIYNNF